MTSHYLYNIEMSTVVATVKENAKSFLSYLFYKKCTLRKKKYFDEDIRGDMCKST